MIHVTKAAPADAFAVAEIVSQTWRAAYSEIIPKDELERFVTQPNRIERTEMRLADPSWYCYIARAGEEPCGIVSFCACTEDENRPGCAMLRQLFALPQYWDAGVGSALLKHALTEIRRQGYSTVALWVFEQNARARRFYEKHHFALDGTSDELMGAIVLRYRLELST